MSAPSRRTLPRALLYATVMGCFSCTESDFAMLTRTDGGSAGGSSSDASSEGGAPALDCAFDLNATPFVAEVQSALTQQCLTRGPEAVVIQDPAFEVTMEDCVGKPIQVFQLIVDDAGAFELRNRATDYNLDVRWAATDDGTSLVLHAPHELFNQRFFITRIGTTDSVQLSPRHAPGKCLALRGAQIELWPCDVTAADQAFRLLTCDTP